MRTRLIKYGRLNVPKIEQVHRDYENWGITDTVDDRPIDDYAAVENYLALYPEQHIEIHALLSSEEEDIYLVKLQVTDIESALVREYVDEVVDAGGEFTIYTPNPKSFYERNEDDYGWVDTRFVLLYHEDNNRHFKQYLNEEGFPC